MNTRCLFSEFLGTLLLIVAVVGSGVMGAKLADGNIAVALLANSTATGAALYVLIQIFGPVSGAHFNPIVSAYAWLKRELSAADMLAYWAVQCLGGMLGAFLVHFTFDLPLLQFSTHARDGASQWASEILASFGLLLTIASFSKHNAKATAAGVALYITGAYWFTSSTSFANPAVTFARMWTDTFAGIAPHSVPGYAVAQFVGLAAFWKTWKILDVPAASRPAGAEGQPLEQSQQHVLT